MIFHHRSVLLGLVLCSLSACGHVGVHSSSNGSGSSSNSSGNSNGQNATVPQTINLEPAASRHVTALFESLADNDDKKAKINYGRASRSLPDLVQFAVDLKLHNFEHAGSALAKTSMTDAQKDFWSKIVAAKPYHLGKAVCEALKNSEPATTVWINPQDLAWKNYFADAVNALVMKMESSDEAPLSAVDEKLAGIQCVEKTVNPRTNNCGPLTLDQQKNLLTEGFFDKIHNMKRRDTRNVKQTYKSAVKVALYEKHAYIRNLKNLLQFFHSLNATEIPSQMHFLRRFKGVGRDMRIESLVNRAMGDLFLGDDGDLKLISKLSSFKDQFQLISEINRLDYELADCDIPQPAPVR